jgi:hypothetical protein
MDVGAPSFDDERDGAGEVAFRSAHRGGDRNSVQSHLVVHDRVTVVARDRRSAEDLRSVMVCG